MTIDLAAARQFLHANARLLDVHRAAHAFDRASAAPVLRALRAYRNDDGGLGHGLEPDVRSPTSETTSTLHGLEVLAELDALDDPMIVGIHDWVAGVSDADGGVPFVLPAAMDYPRGPWMVVAEGGSHLTFGFAALLARAGLRSDWLDAAVAWSWARLDDPDGIDAYTVKYALFFLDHVPDRERALATVGALRGKVRDDGSIAVPGGTEDEKLTVTTLAPRPGAPSRTIFTGAQVAADLDALEAGQREDGGWTVDYLAWCPAQAVEWRGLATLRALQTLRAEGRC